MERMEQVAGPDGWAKRDGAVLVVDDEPHIRSTLRRVLSREFSNVLTSASGALALTLLEHRKVDVAVLDYWMPSMDGLALARAISTRFPQVVQIMLTGCMQVEVVKEAVVRGDLFRYLIKPWDEGELLRTVRRAKLVSRELSNPVQDSEKEGPPGWAPSWLAPVPEWAAPALSLARAVELRDPYTLGHSSRVALISSRMGREKGLCEKDLHELALGALLHDVGKLSIPDAVLFKPSRLSREEFFEVQRHTLTGGSILDRSGAPLTVRAIGRHHHENFDGSGYPTGMAGDKIPLCCRIVRLADAFDAMFSKRPYRDKLSMEEISEEIRGALGTQFDPELSPLLEKVVNKGL